MHRSIKVAFVAAALGATLLPNFSANAATFNAPVVVSPNDVTEPGIEIDQRDGTMYIHGPTGIPLWSSIWRSRDAGATWQFTNGTTRAGLGGGDIDIAIHPDTGHLSSTDLWLGSSSVGNSTNQGDTWINNPVQGTMVQDRQWVAATGGNVTYHVTHQLAAGLVVAKSVDGGITYPVQVVAATTLDQGNCICPPGYLIAEGQSPQTTGGLNDKVGVIYTTATGVKFSRSLNGGTTWTHAVVDPTGGGSTLESFPVVANAGGNKLVAVWMEVNGSSSRIMYSASTNWGQSWGPSKVIVSTGTSVFPWVDARGSKVAVSLYHTTASGNPSNVSNSAQWHLKYLESLDGGTSFSSLAIADPTAVKSGPICVDGINCGSDRELGDFQMVALDPAGKANMSYVRSIDGNYNTEIRYVRQAS